MDPLPAQAPVQQAPAAAPPPTAPAFPRSAQVALFCLLMLAVLLIALDTLKNAPWRARPTELAEGEGRHFRVDLNRASKAELVQVTGIGEKTAEHILEYRGQQPFRSVDDLSRIHGIGPATVAKLRPFVCVDADAAEEASAQPVSARKNVSEGSARSATRRKSPTQMVNINTASEEELQSLPWIGQGRAQDIIRERNKAPFKTVEDLTRVKGIKQGILEKVRDYITVGESPKAE